MTLHWVRVALGRLLRLTNRVGAAAARVLLSHVCRVKAGDASSGACVRRGEGLPATRSKAAALDEADRALVDLELGRLSVTRRSPPAGLPTSAAPAAALTLDNEGQSAALPTSRSGKVDERYTESDILALEMGYTVPKAF